MKESIESAIKNVAEHYKKQGRELSIEYEQKMRNYLKAMFISHIKEEEEQER